MKVYPLLDLLSKDAVLGNHGVWLPKDGIKVPFQWGGRLTKFSRPGEALWSRGAIADEVAILRSLAGIGMAPPVGDFVFFETVRSRYPGSVHTDPCGAFGYEMADANELPPGKFEPDAAARLPDLLPIIGSKAAWSDACKPENVINGYLVDARRSGQDCLRWGGERISLPPIPIDPPALRARVHRECQFPAGERDLAYQDFWLGGVLERGQRRVIERAELLGFKPRMEESVLDIGCQAGGFLQYAWWSAIGGGGKFAAEDLELSRNIRLAGVDTCLEYIECGRALARSCMQNICLHHLDVVTSYDRLLDWVRAYYPAGVDHLLLLSMEKHLGEVRLWQLVDAIKARTTYIETNAVPEGMMKMWREVEARGGRHVGDSRDRNLRRLYVIGR